MDIKVVWILSNYPFRGKTEGDSNNGKMSGGEIIDTVSTALILFTNIVHAQF
ncbi:unknown [Bacteroides sp. CAG:462]|nr:unknown [Bacteroides sp. CAG:462]